MIHVRTATTAEAIDAHADAWRALAERAEQASIFDTYEWQRAWLEAFAPESAARFHFIYEGDALVGVAPLYAGSDAPRWCSAAGVLASAHPHSFRGGVLCDGEPAPVLRALLAHASEHGAPRLVFSDARESSPVARILPALAREQALRTTQAPALPSPLLRIEGTWEDHLRARSNHFAKRMRWKRRHLEAAGRRRLEIVTRAEDCQAAMTAVIAIEAQSWKRELDGSLSANPRLARLYERFALSAARRGWLRLYLLHLDEQPVAFVFGAAWKGEYYVLKIGYDERYQALSPGTVVCEDLFRDAFAAGLCAVDLGPGEAQWKDEVGNDVRNHVDVCVYGARDLRCAACTLFRRELKPRVRALAPGLVRWYRARRAG